MTTAEKPVTERVKANAHTKLVAWLRQAHHAAGMDRALAEAADLSQWLGEVPVLITTSDAEALEEQQLAFYYDAMEVRARKDPEEAGTILFRVGVGCKHPEGYDAAAGWEALDPDARAQEVIGALASAAKVRTRAAKEVVKVQFHLMEQ